MAVKQEMEISISKEGEVQIHVKGWAGKQCLDLTSDLEKALGQVLSREHTSEYFRNEEKSEITDKVKSSL